MGSGLFDVPCWPEREKQDTEQRPVLRLFASRWRAFIKSLSLPIKDARGGHNETRDTA